MIYGITGNTTKDLMWEPAAALAGWLDDNRLPYRLSNSLAEGLAERGLLSTDRSLALASPDLGTDADMILSFGGDGTLLNTVQQCSGSQTPILGVNIGRLGFLTSVDVDGVHEAILDIESQRYMLDERMMLQIDVEDGGQRRSYAALNELVITRSGVAGLITMDVLVNGVDLNTYWADGLIVTTPTGSTAYNLSAGGPILAPGCDAVAVTPLAPHSLTERPIVLSADSEIEVRVRRTANPCVFAADGHSVKAELDLKRFLIRKSPYSIKLVRLEGHDYFSTLRTKLDWGRRKEG